MVEGIRAAAKRLAAVWWALLLIAGVYAELAYMAAWLGLWVDSTATVRFLKIMADAALIMLPYWLLPGRWRWTALIPVWGVAIMCICNSMYYRFFSDCMPIEALYQAGNIHGNMLRSIGGTLKSSDAIAVLIPVAVTALWCVPGLRRVVKAAKMRRSAAVVACAVSAAIFVAGQLAHNSAEQRELGYYFNREVSRGEAFRFRITDREPSQTAIHDSSLRQSGAVVYMMFELYNFLSRDSEIKLTDAERKRLDNIVLWPAGQDSITGSNIVFIVAESLNADAVGRQSGGVAVTPVLDSLISAPGTVYCLSVSPQVDKGMSSDGQLLYNLGTLPPYSGALLYNQAKGKRLPALAAQLRATHATAAIFGEDGRTWDKKHVFECYGYRHVLTSDDSRLHTPFDSIGADMATALYACMVADTLRQPFFIQILSVSSHFPFDKPAECADDLPADPSLSSTENNYLRNIHYLDQSIGALIEGLRERGILDNTIIVVASDHHMNMNGSLAPDRPIVFIAANCGRTQRVDRANQADVFPTLCALFGLKGAWRGVGRAMLDTESDDSDNGRGRRSLSDSLLRSDYFK